MERAYTVAELDALRRAVDAKWMYDSYHGPKFDRAGFAQGRSWFGSERTQEVEHLVRTHLLAGHTAEDLLASEHKPTQDENEARWAREDEAKAAQYAMMLEFQLDHDRHQRCYRDDVVEDPKPDRTEDQKPTNPIHRNPPAPIDEGYGVIIVGLILIALTALAAFMG